MLSSCCRFSYLFPYPPYFKHHSTYPVTLEGCAVAFDVIQVGIYVIAFVVHVLVFPTNVRACYRTHGKSREAQGSPRMRGRHRHLVSQSPVTTPMKGVAPTLPKQPETVGK